MKMKLAFITDNGFSEKDGIFFYSGANVQHYSTVTQNFEEIIFVARKNIYDSSSNPISSQYPVYLINSIASKKSLLKNFKELDRILESVVKESDIVMCFGLNGYFAYKKAKKYNKPVISYIGGCVYDTLVNMDSYLKKMSAPILMSMVKEMVRGSNYVHYVDQYLIDKYPSKGLHLICPSAKIDIDQDVINLRKEKIKNDKSKTVVGIIGYTHNKIKGIDTAIKALKILGSNYKLQIVGRGDHSWLDSLARQYNVEKQIEFLGVLSSRDEVFEWLDSIDIYIQPSLTEGLPRATIEAMSRGCPVVSSNAGGLKNLIDTQYRITGGDYTNLALKIQKINQNQNVLIEEATKNFEKSKKFRSEILDEKRNAFYQMIYQDLSV